MSGLEASLGVLGVGLAIPGLIDLCLKYGRVLIDKIELYRNADKTLNETQLRIDDHWIKIQTELQFVSSVSPRLSNDITEHFSRLLHQLLAKLEVAIRQLDSIYTKSNWRKKVKMAISGSDDIRKVIRELDEWQRCFSDYLLLLTLVGDPIIDTQLNKQNLNGSQSLERIQRIRNAINDPASRTLLLTVEDTPNYTQRSALVDSSPELRITPSFIIEYKSYSFQDELQVTGTELQAMHSDICNLAQVLSASDPMTMNILQCHGFSHDPAKQQFELFYNLPAGHSPPRTLRNLLLSPENKRGAFHPINHRFRLASQLARAVLYIHSAKLVHKNIRPETILISVPAGAGKEEQYPRAIGTPFLVGFSKVREIQAASQRVGDQDREKNLYRHPERQGLHPEQKYNILHDVYSLGVCLLEICLWQSFVLWDPSKTEYKINTSLCSIVQKDIPGTATGQQKLKSPKEIQGTFVKEAQRVIPRIMGEKFAKIVISCLTCLEGGLGSPEEFMDENGVISGVVYVDKVLQMLEEISI